MDGYLVGQTMIVNLVDISTNTSNTSYQGEFSGDITTSIKRDTNRTNLGCGMLDIKNKNMNQKQLIEILRTQFNGNVELLARESDWSMDDIYKILADDFDSSEGLSKGIKRSDHTGDSIQIGDKIEIHAGDGNTNHFAGILNERLKKQKEKIIDQEKLLKEKDETITMLKEMIELLKNK